MIAYFWQVFFIFKLGACNCTPDFTSSIYCQGAILNGICAHNQVRGSRLQVCFWKQLMCAHTHIRATSSIFSGRRMCAHIIVRLRIVPGRFVCTHIIIYSQVRSRYVAGSSWCVHTSCRFISGSKICAHIQVSGLLLEARCAYTLHT